MSRRVYVTVSYGLLSAWLTAKDEAIGRWVTTDLAADARVVGITDSPYRECARIYLESESFADVPELSDPPEIKPMYTQHWADVVERELVAA